jgi:hypothetical protein
MYNSVSKTVYLPFGLRVLYELFRADTDQKYFRSIVFSEYKLSSVGVGSGNPSIISSKCNLWTGSFQYFFFLRTEVVEMRAAVPLRRRYIDPALCDERLRVTYVTG